MIKKALKFINDRLKFISYSDSFYYNSLIFFLLWKSFTLLNNPDIQFFKLDE